jgi:RNA recognition motif-containing protein
MNITLYVGNLPWSTTAEELLTWVSPFTQAISARVVSDRQTGRSRGFGFIEIEAEAAPKVIEALNGTILGGRVVTVNEAQSRQR